MNSKREKQRSGGGQEAPTGYYSSACSHTKLIFPLIYVVVYTSLLLLYCDLRYNHIRRVHDTMTHLLQNYLFGAALATWSTLRALAILGSRCNNSHIGHARSPLMTYTFHGGQIIGPHDLHGP